MSCAGGLSKPEADLDSPAIWYQPAKARRSRAGQAILPVAGSGVQGHIFGRRSGRRRAPQRLIADPEAVTPVRPRGPRALPGVLARLDALVAAWSAGVQVGLVRWRVVQNRYVRSPGPCLGNAGVDLRRASELRTDVSGRCRRRILCDCLTRYGWLEDSERRAAKTCASCGLRR